MIKDDRLQVPQAGLVEATWEDTTAAMGPLSHWIFPESPQ